MVERMRSEEEVVDFDGKFFSLEGVKSAPKPYFGDRPILVSAGNSPVGRDFALRRTDYVFMGTCEIDQLAAEVAAMTAVAPAPHMYFGCGNLLCRPTRKEAEELSLHRP